MLGLEEDSSPVIIDGPNDIPGNSPFGWDCISGFFDGEGSVAIETRSDSGVLIITLTFSQRYRPLLEAMARFLGARGIACTVCKNSETVHEIRIRGIESVCKLLRELNLILKRRRALATLACFDGKMTGNEAIEVFDHEFRLGRGRPTPFRPGVNFPLRHSDAVLNAGKATGRLQHGPRI